MSRMECRVSSVECRALLVEACRCAGVCACVCVCVEVWRCCGVVVVVEVWRCDGVKGVKV